MVKAAETRPGRSAPAEAPVSSRSDDLSLDASTSGPGRTTTSVTARGRGGPMARTSDPLSRLADRLEPAPRRQRHRGQRSRPRSRSVRLRRRQPRSPDDRALHRRFSMRPKSHYAHPFRRRRAGAASLYRGSPMQRKRHHLRRGHPRGDRQEMARDPSVIVLGLERRRSKGHLGHDSGLAGKYRPRARLRYAAGGRGDDRRGHRRGAGRHAPDPHAHPHGFHDAGDEPARSTSPPRAATCTAAACRSRWSIRSVIGRSWGQGAQHSQGLHSLLHAHPRPEGSRADHAV